MKCGRPRGHGSGKLGAGSGKLGLTQRERDLDEDQHRHRLAEAHARLEPPLTQRLDGFPVEAKLLVEGVEDADVSDAAVGHHDRFEFDETLDAGAHRLAGVVWLGFVNQDWRTDAVALSIGPTAKSSA